MKNYKKELEDAIICIDLQKKEIKRQISMRKSALKKGVMLGFFACIGCIYLFKGLSLLINLIF